MSSTYSFRALVVAFALVVTLAACGSDDTTNVVANQPADGAGDYTADNPTEPGDGDPIPVEPDGGIGDGAGPLPGADEPSLDEGTWHGAIVAETNCPGVEWQRVQASAFSFSVPIDFENQEVQGVDSEVALWKGDGIEVDYDYGWYSGRISGEAGAVVEQIDYSGIAGEHVIVVGEDGRNVVGVYFGEVRQEYDEWNKLGLSVRHEDAADEIIGRCIVASIEWS